MTEIDLNCLTLNADVLNIVEIVRALLTLITIGVFVGLVIWVVIDVMKTIASGNVDTSQLFKSVSNRILGAVIVILVVPIINIVFGIIEPENFDGDRATHLYIAYYHCATTEIILEIRVNDARTAMMEFENYPNFLNYEKAIFAVSRMAASSEKESFMAYLNAFAEDMRRVAARPEVPIPTPLTPPNPATGGGPGDSGDAPPPGGGGSGGGGGGGGGSVGSAGIFTGAPPPPPRAVQHLNRSTNNGIFPNGAVFDIQDIATGTRFRGQVFSNNGRGNHLDVVPATATDTNIMRSMVGIGTNGQPRWSWSARPIIVTHRGQRYAASMHTMPHHSGISGRGYITPAGQDGAGREGHFCMYFWNSGTAQRQRQYIWNMQQGVIDAFNRAR